MPFNWGLGGDVASIGLPRSKASPPMLISQGQEEPLQCFSFEGGLKIQQQEPCCIGRRGKKKREQAGSIRLPACEDHRGQNTEVLVLNNKTQTCVLDAGS